MSLAISDSGSLRLNGIRNFHDNCVCAALYVYSHVFSSQDHLTQRHIYHKLQLFFSLHPRYLLQPETWSRCLQPLHIVEWNITLLCVLLGLAVLEFIICLLQLGNGLVNAICRPCCYKQEYSLNA